MTKSIIRYVNGFFSGVISETIGYQKSKNYRTNCIRDGNWIDGFDLAGTVIDNLKYKIKKTAKGISNGKTI